MGLIDKIKNLLGGEEPSAVSDSDSSAARPGADDPAPQSGTSPVASAPHDSSDLLDCLKQKVSELSTGQLTVDSIDPAVSLFDFGYLDSLTAVTMISFIDSEFGVSINELDMVEELDHLQALAEHVARHRTR